MSVQLTVEQVKVFSRDGFLGVPGFYDLAADIEPIQHGIHRVIGLLLEKHGLPPVPPFAPNTFDAGYLDLIAKDRALGGVVYDAVKQLSAFVRFVTHPEHERLLRQLRGTNLAGVAAGGSGIRIDNPGEEKYRAGWHQEYPAQSRSLDGLVFWSPLVPVTEALGPVEFCVGSHSAGPVPVRTRDLEHPEKAGAYALVLADEAERVARYGHVAPLTKPGDLVIIDYLTLHRSGENCSDRARWSMQIRWFNFCEPTGLRLGWPGSFAVGNDLRTLHPELFVD
jgi:hypothetical protein|tara:strand:- start:4 stop:843 length:840 start_codon:yes stop_codon:yes gene_type:complete